MSAAGARCKSMVRYPKPDGRRFRCQLSSGHKPTFYHKHYRNGQTLRWKEFNAIKLSSYEDHG